MVQSCLGRLNAWFLLHKGGKYRPTLQTNPQTPNEKADDACEARKSLNTKRCSGKQRSQALLLSKLRILHTIKPASGNQKDGGFLVTTLAPKARRPLDIQSIRRKLTSCQTAGDSIAQPSCLVRQKKKALRHAEKGPSLPT